jgi:predicted NodU family carbamoyl transferase
MYILSLHLGHDGAYTIIKDNQIIEHCQVDRFTKQKMQSYITGSLLYHLSSLDIKFDIVLLTDLIYADYSLDRWWFKTNLTRFDLIHDNTEIVFNDTLKTRHHHLWHAYCSKASLGPNKNYAVIDGGGVWIKDKNWIESESIYDNNFNCTYKAAGEIGHRYDHMTAALFKLNRLNSMGMHGKLMALSQYGTKEVSLEQNFILSEDKDDKKSQDYLYSFQKNFEKEIDEIIPKENVNYSGGCAQSILCNTNYLLNKNFNIDPLCNDSGISLGQANHYLKGNIKQIKDVYLGPQPDYQFIEILFKDWQLIETDNHKVANIVKDTPIALFQGRSEQGQRALGNRSLLMNPFHKNAVSKVNEIKKREWYRPFSPSVTEEESNNYFYIENTISPYMLYVFNTKQDLPSVSSVNKLSRVHTVSKKQNKHYHDLLSKNDGMLLNTSLNFPGHVVVENLYDLKWMMERSPLKYAWLPDIGKLIKKI